MVMVFRTVPRTPLIISKSTPTCSRYFPPLSSGSVKAEADHWFGQVGSAHNDILVSQSLPAWYEPATTRRATTGRRGPHAFAPRGTLRAEIRLGRGLERLHPARKQKRKELRQTHRISANEV